MKRAPSEQGFALLLAIFIVVFLAMAAAVLTRSFGYSTQNATFSAQHARAMAAARSGLSWAAYRAINAADCSTFNFTLDDVGLGGFRVSGTCTATSHRLLANDVTVYAINVIASIGTYGSADFIARELRAKYFDG